MSLQDLFEGEEHNTEVTPTISNVVSIITPLFDIHFKKHDCGDVVVDGSKGITPLNVINGILDQSCNTIARLVYDIQAAVEGIQAIGNETAKLPSAYFDDESAMKGEYKAMCSEAQVVRAERLWQEIQVHYEVLKTATRQREENFPNVSRPPQYMYCGPRHSNVLGVEEGPIYSASTAIKYRMATDSRRMIALRNSKESINLESSLEDVANAF